MYKAQSRAFGKYSSEWTTKVFLMFRLHNLTLFPFVLLQSNFSWISLPFYDVKWMGFFFSHAMIYAKIVDSANDVSECIFHPDDP